MIDTLNFCAAVYAAYCTFVWVYCMIRWAGLEWTEGGHWRFDMFVK